MHDDLKEREPTSTTKNIQVHPSGLTVGWNVLVSIIFLVGTLYVTNQLSPLKAGLDRLRRDVNEQMLELHGLKEHKQQKMIEEAERVTDFKGRMKIVEEKMATITKIIIEEGCLKK